MLVTSFITPASLLADCFKHCDAVQGRLILVSGISGVGKTRWCLDLLQQALEAQKSHLELKIAGLVSPGCFEQGEKIGIDLVDISSKERRRLAQRLNEREPGRGTFTDDWVFNEDTLAWGETCLQRIQNCDLFILDELGPLEFVREKGWQSGLAFIDSGEYRVACVVIRTSLVIAAQRRWPWAEMLQIEP